MAFCNSCGATLDSGVKFCNKCGATQPGTASSAPVTGAAPAPAKSGSALKIILIVVAVIAGLGILGVAGIAFTAWHFAKGTRVRDRDGNVRVETPFGTVQSTTDPDEAARNLGIDLYPGAEVKQGSAANMSFGGMKTVAADFETDDPPQAVADFYKGKFPGARFASSDADHFTLVSTEGRNLLTINIEPGGGGTRIHIAKVTKPGGSDN